MSQEAARPYIGGQAVIEGVMMRSPGSLAVVCRRRSGELVVRERPMPPAPKGGWKSLPFVRGVATLVESLKLGSAALRWSAELLEQDLIAEEKEREEKEKASKAKPPKAPKSGAGALSAFAISMFALTTGDPGAPSTLPEDDKKGGGLMTLFSIVLAVGLFVALPQASAEGVNKLFNLGLAVNAPAFQAITGVAKLCVVLGYMMVLRQSEIGRRLFEYHGAEHKTISTYEAQEDLVVENAKRKTTLHPRCGTTFLVMVALVSIAMFSVLGAFLPKLPGGRVAESVGFFFMKLPFLPLIAAITYEIQRIFARYCTVGPLRALLWPGFLVQKITTKEPDDAELEVALASLRATLWREEALEAPAPADRTFAGYGELLADPGYARV